MTALKGFVTMIGAGAIAATALIASIAVAPASFAAVQCETEVNGRLAELGIDALNVARIHYLAELSRGRSSTISTGTKARVSLLSCKGTVVIHLSRTCRIKQTYARGACTVPGLKQY